MLREDLNDPQDIHDLRPAHLRPWSQHLLDSTDWNGDDWKFYPSSSPWDWGFIVFACLLFGMAGATILGMDYGLVYGLLFAAFAVALCPWLMYFTTPRGMQRRKYSQIRPKLHAHLYRCAEFNGRLKTMQEYAKLPGSDQPEPGVVSKFADEWSELDTVSEELEKERQLRERELKLIELGGRLNKAPNQGQFRETRDVSDLVYVNVEKMRVESAELEKMLADHPPPLDETEDVPSKRHPVE